MYSLLVAAALREEAQDEHEAEPPGMILGRLIEHRSHLSGGAGGGSDAATEVAAQIRYDVTLMHLCAALGIEHDPAAFSRPSVERQRLESALRQSGIDLEAF